MQPKFSSLGKLMIRHALITWSHTFFSTRKRQCKPDNLEEQSAVLYTVLDGCDKRALPGLYGKEWAERPSPAQGTGGVRL